MGLSPTTLSYAMYKTKEEDNSPFSAHCAVSVLRKRELSSSFVLCFEQEIHSVTVPNTWTRRRFRKSIFVTGI